MPTPDIVPHIFKSYDVRGRVGPEITEDVLERVGRAVVRTLDAKAIAVGRDMREHSPRLEAAIVKGITAAGANAIRIGQCSTPMSYFAAATLDVDGAVMVTASHNPGHDNGVKFSKRGGQPMGQGTGLEIVREMVLSGQTDEFVVATPGLESEHEILGEWCEHLKQYAPTPKPMKIVIDCGNGVVGPVIHEIVKTVDPNGALDIIWLFDEPDGSFPWHPADPLRLVNLQHLQGAVLATKADLGIAFDGDGDRLAFVDENARFIGCDLMTALFAQELLSYPENAGKGVLYDLRSSQAVADVVQAAGGIAEMSRVGHSHVKAAMRGLREGRVLNPEAEVDTIFAGELSGHFFFKDCFTIDTSERAFLLALTVLGKTDKRLSELIAPIRKYWHSGEINYQLGSRDAMDAALSSVESTFDGNPIIKLDGVTVDLPDARFNVRMSNTEPVLRVTAESRTSAAGLSALLEQIEGLLHKHGATLH